MRYIRLFMFMKHKILKINKYIHVFNNCLTKNGFFEWWSIMFWYVDIWTKS